MKKAHRLICAMAYLFGSPPDVCLPFKLLLLPPPQAAVSASVSIQCTPVGCVQRLKANARRIGNVSGWPGSVSLKTSGHVAMFVAVQ